MGRGIEALASIHISHLLHLLPQVVNVINSYELSKMVSQFLDGTRQWMFDEIDAWAMSGASRLMLLLAPPGMGKTIISAVASTKLKVRWELPERVICLIFILFCTPSTQVLLNSEANLVLVQHFFKVGQARSQGRAMVLCIAQQLAEKLPGFASLLAGVVKEHGDGKTIPNLREVFVKCVGGHWPLWEGVSLSLRGCQQIVYLFMSSFFPLLRPFTPPTPISGSCWSLS